jgi:hypothetical protein
MRTKSFLLALSALCSSAAAFGQNVTVTTNSSLSAGLLQLGGAGLNGQILVSANDWWGVIRAAQDLAIDFGKATGTNLTLGNWQGAVMPGAGNYSKRTEHDRRDPDPQWGWWGPPQPPHGGDGGGGPNGGSWNPRQTSPPSSEHNDTEGSPASSETTVYYTYQPTTNFVNVSPPQEITLSFMANKLEVHRRTYAELYRADSCQQFHAQDSNYRRHNRQVRRDRRLARCPEVE